MIKKNESCILVSQRALHIDEYMWQKVDTQVILSRLIATTAPCIVEEYIHNARERVLKNKKNWCTQPVRQPGEQNSLSSETSYSNNLALSLSGKKPENTPFLAETAGTDVLDLSQMFLPRFDGPNHPPHELVHTDKSDW